MRGYLCVDVLCGEVACVRGYLFGEITCPCEEEDNF